MAGTRMKFVSPSAVSETSTAADWALWPELSVGLFDLFGSFDCFDRESSEPPFVPRLLHHCRSSAFVHAAWQSPKS